MELCNWDTWVKVVDMFMWFLFVHNVAHSYLFFTQMITNWRCRNKELVYTADVTHQVKQHLRTTWISDVSGPFRRILTKFHLSMFHKTKMLHIRFKLWRQDNYLGKRKFIKSPITAMNTNINGDQVNLFMVSSPWLENTKSHLFTDVVQKLSGDIKDWTI